MFYPKDAGGTFLRNVSKLLPDYTISHPKTQFGGDSVSCLHDNEFQILKVKI
jgi:hypothetical protein